MKRDNLKGLLLLLIGLICFLSAFIVIQSIKDTSAHTDLSYKTIHVGEEIELTESNSSKYIDASSVDSKNEFQNKWCVYITGAVCSPGVKQVPAKCRVDDVVKIAGGLKQSADEVAINLAAKVCDGEHIHIPYNTNVGDNSLCNKGTEYLEKNEYSKGRISNEVTHHSCYRSIININTANADELQKLPGIGPKIARRIIEYRRINGAFDHKEDIQNVKGIGPKKYKRLESLVGVR